MNRCEQKIFDITVFTWECWDELETGFLQFYDVEFPYESMKKYNGSDVSLDMNGEITIYSNDEESAELWKGFIIEIPEFLEELEKKFEK